MRLLLERGAQTNLKDDSGRKPIDRAAAKGHLNIIKLLEQLGERVNLENDKVREAIGVYGWNILDGMVYATEACQEPWSSSSSTTGDST